MKLSQIILMYRHLLPNMVFLRVVNHFIRNIEKLKRESNPHSKLKFNLETSLPVQKPLLFQNKIN